MNRYYCTGWCSRYQLWKAEVLDAKNKLDAKTKFGIGNGNLRNLKVYRLLKEKQHGIR